MRGLGGYPCSLDHAAPTLRLGNNQFAKCRRRTGCGLNTLIEQTLDNARIHQKAQQHLAQGRAHKAEALYRQLLSQANVIDFEYNEWLEEQKEEEDADE